jgi:hypothetical protein
VNFVGQRLSLNTKNRRAVVKIAVQRIMGVKMTDRKQFKDYLQKRGFSLSEVLCYKDMIPVAKQDMSGNKYLLWSIGICIFEGSNTKPGGLGCVTFFIRGKRKQKYYRSSYEVEAFKKAFCPKNVTEAIKEFTLWYEKSIKTMENWKTIV